MEVEVNSDSEDEILVYAEFNESVDIEKYRSIHVLGIDGKNPIIQADDTFFTGKFVNALGTYMFFEEDTSPKSEDPLFDPLSEKNLKYLTKTSKVLKLEHAYVLPKSGEQVSLNETEETSQEVQPIKFSSIEDALNQFKTILIPNPDETKNDGIKNEVIKHEVTQTKPLEPSEPMDT